jgi:hypothetical protein
MRIVAVLSLLGVVGCSVSPVSFYRSETRLDCKYLKKCNEAEFDNRGYKSVADCREKNLSDEELDDRVDACDVYDQNLGRKCLNGKRKNIRECDRNAADAEQLEACSKACSPD